MVAQNDAFATPLALNDLDPITSAESVWDDATVEPGEDSAWVFGDGSSLPYRATLWWSWVGKAGEASLNASTDVSTRISVYTGSSLGALTLVTAPSGQPEWTAEAGTVYRVQTAALSDPVGPITMRLTFTPAPPPPPPPPYTASDSTDLAGSRVRSGSGEDHSLRPVTPRPAHLVADPVRVLAQQLPTPILKNGRPQ